jgi:hypothetical protein
MRVKQNGGGAVMCRDYAAWDRKFAIRLHAFCAKRTRMHGFSVWLFS